MATDTNLTTQRPLAAITGATVGIGAEFARRLAREGYDLLLVSRDLARLNAVADQIREAANVNVETLSLDLSEDQGNSRLEAELADRPRLELLVNNAGFLLKGDLTQADLEGLRRMNTLHMEAPMRACRAALPGMMQRNKGAIINVASIAGMVCSPGNINYCSTKAYLIHFSEGLELEMRLAGKKVHIQALCPGYTRTEIHARAGVSPRDIPAGLWLKCADVVDYSLRMLKTRKVVVVPGGNYRFLTGLLRLLPRTWVSGLVHREQRVQRRRRANKDS